MCTLRLYSPSVGVRLNELEIPEVEVLSTSLRLKESLLLPRLCVGDSTFPPPPSEMGDGGSRVSVCCALGAGKECAEATNEVCVRVATKPVMNRRYRIQVCRQLTTDEPHR